MPVHPGPFQKLPGSNALFELWRGDEIILTPILFVLPWRARRIRNRLPHLPHLRHNLLTQ
jgi:hypothetical protein